MELTEFLENDDAIDELTERQIRDVWVRATVAKRLFRARRWHDHEDWAESLLTDGADFALWLVHSRILGRSHKVTAKLRPQGEESDGFGFNSQQLWEEFTRAPDETKRDRVDIARDKLKEMLRCSGMPHMKVARGRIRYYLSD